MAPGRLLDHASSSVPSTVPASLKTAMGVQSQQFHQTQSISTLDTSKNPLERTWRGNRAGTVRYNGYPDFGNDTYAHRQYIKVSLAECVYIRGRDLLNYQLQEHLAGAFQYFGKCGFGDGLSGKFPFIEIKIVPYRRCYGSFADRLRPRL